MRLFSGFLLILVFAVSACTGDDTVREIDKVKIQCPNNGPIVEEGESCPDPSPSPPIQQPPTQQPPTDRDTTSSDCNINVDGLQYTAGSGDERVCGNEKDNVIRGEEGDDTLYGGAGNDTLYGGEDRDTLKGEAGDDTLVGGEGNDILDGGEGSDTADYGKEFNANLGGDDGSATVGSGVEVDLAGGSAVDTYGDDDTLKDIENVVGTLEADDIKGDSGSNVIEGNGAPDNTNDKLDGRGGEDTIVVSTTPFDLSAVQDATTEDPNIKGFENIQGKGSAVLTLTGDGKSNKITGVDATNADGTTGDVLDGGAGNDVLMGLKGSDTLNGGPGNDKLYGGIGNDKLNGQAGADTLSGGEGNDCFLIVIPDFADPAPSFGNDVSSDPGNNDRKVIVRSTKDTISDYQDGDTIVIGGTTGTVYTMDTSKDSTVAVKSVIVSKGRIDVVTQAYRAVAGQETTDDATDDVKAISQQTEQLVVVSGLTEARFDSVSIGSACP